MNSIQLTLSPSHRASRREFLRRAGLATAAAPGLFGGLRLIASDPPPASSVIRITDHGARTRRDTLNTTAIQAAIDACHQAGGGSVTSPRAGTLHPEQSGPDSNRPDLG